MLGKLYVIYEYGMKDITERVGNIAWTSDSAGLSVNLTFDYAGVDDEELKTFDQILLDDEGDPVFYGVITSISVNGGKVSISAFDFGFYLNKSEVIIQFNKSKASTAVQMLLKNLNIKSGHLPTMNTVINKIYKDVKVSDVLNDILDQVFLETGKKYFFEMAYDVLNIYEMGAETIDITYKMAENLAPVTLEDVLSKGFNMTESVEDLRNSVVVVSSESDSLRVVEEVSDQESVDKNGLLREIVTVDLKNESEARNISRQLLSQLNKITQSTTIPLLGHKKLKKYRRVKIDMPELKLSGEYLILSAAHTYAGGLYKTTINVEVI